MPESHLAIGLLGTLEFTGVLEPLTPLLHRKTAALLAYVAAHAGTPVHRGTLASLLWGSLDDRRARTSLRQELSLLRLAANQTGLELFQSSGDTLQLASGIDVDVVLFRRAYNIGSKISLLAAADLYRGAFLDAVVIATAEFQDWQLRERESLKAMIIDIHDRLAALHLDDNDPNAAVSAARTLVLHDEYRERSRMLLMRALAASGRRVEAVREYWRYHRLLGESLQVAPSVELRSMMESLRVRSPPPPNGKIRENGVAAIETTTSDERPVIAVLPFVSVISAENGQQLANIVTGDVISGLSCDPRLSVISFNSIARYQSDLRNTKAISTTLKADYAADGRLRRTRSSWIISVSLTDSESGRELWGGKREFGAEELLDIIDDAVESIVIALASHLKLTESTRFKRKYPSDLEAWRLASLAAQVFIQNPTDSLDAQLLMAERAVALDDNYAFAWAVLGFLIAFKFPLGISKNHAQDVERSLQATSKALKLDPRIPMALTAHGIALQYAGRPRDSLEFLRRSLRLNASDTLTHCYYGRGATFSGNALEAIAHFERFERLNPDDPAAHMAGMYHAVALMFLNHWAEAEHVARRAHADAGGRNHWVLAVLAIVCAAQNDHRAARAMIDELASVAPHWDRDFINGFLSACQEDASLMAPISAIIKQNLARAVIGRVGGAPRSRTRPVRADTRRLASGPVNSRKNHALRDIQITLHQ